MLGGQTAAQIIANTLGQVPKGISVSVTTGNIGDGGTIPLPSGYSRQQCQYTVWATEMSEDSDEYGRSHRQQLSVNQSNGSVVSRLGRYGYSNKWYSVTAGYLCIAVK